MTTQAEKNTQETSSYTTQKSEANSITKAKACAFFKDLSEKKTPRDTSQILESELDQSGKQSPSWGKWSRVSTKSK